MLPQKLDVCKLNFFYKLVYKYLILNVMDTNLPNILNTASKRYTLNAMCNRNAFIMSQIMFYFITTVPTNLNKQTDIFNIVVSFHSYYIWKDSRYIPIDFKLRLNFENTEITYHLVFISS